MNTFLSQILFLLAWFQVTLSRELPSHAAVASFKVRYRWTEGVTFVLLDYYVILMKYILHVFLSVNFCLYNYREPVGAQLQICRFSLDPLKTRYYSITF